MTKYKAFMEYYTRELNTSNHDNRLIKPYLGKTIVFEHDDIKSEVYQKICNDEARSIIFDIVNTADSISPEINEKIYPFFESDDDLSFLIYMVLETKNHNHFMFSAILDFMDKIRNFNTENMTEKDVSDLKDCISKMQDQINKLNIENKQKEITICQQAKIIADSMNNDRWITIPKFYNVIKTEGWGKKNKVDDDSKKRITKERLEERQCFSMFKSNKQGRYFQIADVVNAAKDLEYIDEWSIKSIIEEMKIEANSKTRTELEAEGFEMSNKSK